MGLDGKKTKLRNAEITKVDAVPSGAQQDSHIEIFKSVDEPNKLNNKEDTIMNEEEIKKAAEEGEKVKKAMEEVEAKKAFDLKAKLKAEEDAKEMEAEKTKKAAACNMVDKEAPSIEEVMKMFYAQKSENDQLKQAVAKMADEKVEKEYIAKAAEFEGLSISAEEFGPVLKSIAVAVPEAYAKLETVLKAANQAILSGGMFAECGSSSTFTSAVSKSDAWGQIVALADSIVAKGNTTSAKAIDDVLKTVEGKKLYAIYTGKLA